MAAFLLQHFEAYKNAAFEVTGEEQKNFQEVADLLRKSSESPSIQNPDPVLLLLDEKKGRVIVI
jgi:DNA-directed RNA polymerase subunit H (RpoH/RPB5)